MKFYTHHFFLVPIGIYRSTQFGNEIGFGLVIGGTQLYETSDAPGNPVTGSSYTANDYLETFSNKMKGIDR